VRRHLCSITRLAALAAAALLGLAPAESRAAVRLLDRDLLGPQPWADLAVRADQGGGGSQPDEKQGDGAQSGQEAKPAEPGSLDFDLLGKPAEVPEAADVKKVARRRQMLTLHQGIGIGLYALQVATTVVGQLNYLDKFGDANTGKYKLSHQVLAYTNLSVFVVNGALALLTPDVGGEHKGQGVDRVTKHKIGMYTAAGLMLAQIVTGVLTSSQEGHLNQQDIARVHLAMGYATLAAMTFGVGAIVF
jgi:hypothetical protein